MISIEKCFAIPVVMGRKYPWEKMKVGDSFQYEGKISGISSAATYAGRKLNVKFACRTISPGVVRVWRVE